MSKIITSWDDGSKHDMRLAKLLKKYNIPAIFYIPALCELENYEIKEISDMGFEIGGHTYSHPPDMKRLDDHSLEFEISEGKEFLEHITGKEITKFAYPKGKYNENTIKMLKKCGFTEARTTVTGSIEHPDELDMFRIKTSVHCYPETPKYNKPNWYKEAVRLYKEAKEKNGRFELWGHSFELQKWSMFEELEKFFKYINKYGQNKRLPT